MASGWALIVLGNLMQGGFVEAFLKPFYASSNQYYSDAILVQNWRDWLANFNLNQPFYWDTPKHIHLLLY